MSPFVIMDGSGHSTTSNKKKKRYRAVGGTEQMDSEQEDRVSSQKKPAKKGGPEAGDMLSSSSSSLNETKLSAYHYFKTHGLYDEGRPMYSNQLVIGPMDKAMMLCGTIDACFKKAEEYFPPHSTYREGDCKEFLLEVLGRCNETEVLNAWNEWKGRHSETRSIRHDTDLADNEGISPVQPAVEVESNISVPSVASKDYTISAFDFLNESRFFHSRRWQRKFVEEYSTLKFLIGPLEEFFEKALTEEQKSEWDLEKFFLDLINPDSEHEVIKVYQKWKRQRNLRCFSARVNGLFKWLDYLEPYPDAFERMFVYYEHLQYVGPFFCLAQSNHMGQVNLMNEYRNVSNVHSDASSEQADGVASYLILLADAKMMDKNDEEKVYDFKVDLLETARRRYSSAEATDWVFSELDSLFAKIEQKNGYRDNRIALLFYESPILLERNFGCDAYVFRCVRRWLREPRGNTFVVAVFEGTKIADFYDPSDSVPWPPGRDDRQMPVMDRQYTPNGSKFYPAFHPVTTM
jgi:hypothetical protein